jgi:HEAT repeat protein
MVLNLREAMEQLGDASSTRRRAAAKRLRELRDPVAGPVLLAALQEEIKKTRTWETQYQLIMALGVCGHDPALPFLKDLAVSRALNTDSVYTALGDAIVRLGRSFDDDTSPVFWCMELNHDALVDGAFRAMAMLQMVPNSNDVGRIICFVDQRGSYDMLRFWPAVAAAGWAREVVYDFLRKCADGEREDVAEAAKGSLAGEYRNYQIL